MHPCPAQSAYVKAEKWTSVSPFLKALCTEAAVHALRRRYPQIYEVRQCRLTLSDPR